jgi:magnesium chelatase family protein
MNPCPCGHLGSDRCRCSPERVLGYQARLSGPLLDRIDIQLLVQPVDERVLTGPGDGEPDDRVRTRVAEAWARQQRRQQTSNATLDPAAIDRHCLPDSAGSELLHAAARRLRWSSRALHRVLRLARTIADLAGRNDIATADIAEAVGYRRGLATG